MSAEAFDPDYVRWEPGSLYAASVEVSSIVRDIESARANSGQMDWRRAMVAIYTGILILLLLGFSLVRYIWNHARKRQGTPHA